MAKFCGKCGTALNDTAIFCGGCGNKVPAAYSAPAVAQATFTPAPQTPAPQAPAPNPGNYTPVASAYTTVDSAFTPSPATPVVDAGGFAPVPDFATVPAAYTPTPETYAPPSPATPAANPGGFAPVPDFAPAPAAYTPPTVASFTPSPAKPGPDPAGFAPVPGYTPNAPAYTPPVMATPAAGPAGFAPVPGYTPAPAAYAPPAPAYTPPPTTYTPGQAYTPANAYPAKKSNTLIKVLVAFVLLIFVGGALALAGLWYAAQQIKAKAHAVTARVLGGAAPATTGGLFGDSTSDDSPGGFKGDPCRFLTKAEVSHAVGLTVIRTEGKDGGCSYIAKGDPADVTAKHMSSMLAGLGADAKTQQMAQKFAGGLFAQQEASDKALSKEAATGEIPVLVLSFTAGNADLEMKANRAGFEHIKGGAPGANAVNSATGDLTGIGDEAYVAGGSMIMLRKGNVTARFMYVSCPCNTDNIKPLAQTVARRL